MRLSFLGLEKGESPVYCLCLNELWVSGCLQQSWALLILYIKHANKYRYGCITQAKGVQRAGPDHKGPLHGQGWVTDAQSCFVSAGHTGLCVCFVRSVCPHFFYYMQILMWESEFWLFFSVYEVHWSEHPNVCDTRGSLMGSESERGFSTSSHWFYVLEITVLRVTPTWAHTKLCLFSVMMLYLCRYSEWIGKGISSVSPSEKNGENNPVNASECSDCWNKTNLKAETCQPWRNCIFVDTSHPVLITVVEAATPDCCNK